MKRTMVALGVISPLLLVAVCVGMLIIVSVSVLLLPDQPQQSRAIRILPAAPLVFQEATAPPVENQTADQPSELVESVPEVAVQDAPEPTEVAQSVNQPVAAKNEASLSSEEVEEALGFALPAGSVNSITEEGIGTRLVIPKLDIDRPIVISPIENQTWQVDHLEQRVGHLEGTAPPGSNSNLVLAAHVTLSEGVYGPFAGLAQLAPGDAIYVYNGDQVFEYVVDGYQTVDRTSIEVTYPSDAGEVTLITCNNWNAAEGRYDQRLVVKGHLVEG